MGEQASGYELIDHPSEVGVRAWGPTPEDAFVAARRGWPGASRSMTVIIVSCACATAMRTRSLPACAEPPRRAGAPGSAWRRSSSAVSYPGHGADMRPATVLLGSAGRLPSFLGGILSTGGRQGAAETGACDLDVLRSRRQHALAMRAEQDIGRCRLLAGWADNRRAGSFRSTTSTKQGHGNLPHSSSGYPRRGTSDAAPRYSARQHKPSQATTQRDRSHGPEANLPPRSRRGALPRPTRLADGEGRLLDVPARHLVGAEEVGLLGVDQRASRCRAGRPVRFHRSLGSARP